MVQGIAELLNSTVGATIPCSPFLVSQHSFETLLETFPVGSSPLCQLISFAPPVFGEVLQNVKACRDLLTANRVLYHLLS